MKLARKLTLTLMTLAAGAVLGLPHAGAASLEEKIDPAWSQSSWWDDGKAEVATYQAQRVIYGKARLDEQQVHVLVAEPFHAEQLVKADPPYAGKPVTPVLKHHVTQHYETENYPYNLAASQFVVRADPARLLKATFVGYEWCGITFKEFRLGQTEPVFVSHSYWEDEAHQTVPLDWAGEALLQDQLAVTLRALRLAPGEQTDVRLIPPQVGNKAPRPEPVAATITRSEAAEALQAGGEVYEPAEQVVYRVETGAGEAATYVFGAEMPHALLHFEHSDGRRLSLKSIERRAYWER